MGILEELKRGGTDREGGGGPTELAKDFGMRAGREGGSGDGVGDTPSSMSSFGGDPESKTLLFCKSSLLKIKTMTTRLPLLRGVSLSSSLGDRQPVIAVMPPAPASWGVGGPPSKGVSAERTVLGEPGVLGVVPPPPLSTWWWWG